MMHSPVLRTIGMITWVITALVSINVLTAVYDYDFIEWFVVRMPNAGMPLVWIIGLSGIVSLALFIKMSLFMCCPGCGSCPCTCNTTNNTNNF